MHQRGVRKYGRQQQRSRSYSGNMGERMYNRQPGHYDPYAQQNTRRRPHARGPSKQCTIWSAQSYSTQQKPQAPSRQRDARHYYAQQTLQAPSRQQDAICYYTQQNPQPALGRLEPPFNDITPKREQPIFNKEQTDAVIAFFKTFTAEPLVQHMVKKKETHSEFVQRIFSKESLARRDPEAISMLYSGRQCSSCPTRFPSNRDTSEEYRRHLDEHFHRNREERTNRWRRSGREWYVLDFQAPAADNDGATPYVESTVSNETCPVCREQFDYRYNDEAEAWIIQNAIRVDGTAFHPLCREDYNK